MCVFIGIVIELVGLFVWLGVELFKCMLLDVGCECVLVCLLVGISVLWDV